MENPRPSRSPPPPYRSSPPPCRSPPASLLVDVTSGSFDFQGRSKTEAARTKVAQEVYKELRNARQEALQRKKAERRKMMEEAESNLNTDALRKRETKERAQQLKKAMPKIKMSRGTYLHTG